MEFFLCDLLQVVIKGVGDEFLFFPHPSPLGCCSGCVLGQYNCGVVSNSFVRFSSVEGWGLVVSRAIHLRRSIL